MAQQARLFDANTGKTFRRSIDIFEKCVTNSDSYSSLRVAHYTNSYYNFLSKLFFVKDRRITQFYIIENISRVLNGRSPLNTRKRDK